MPSRPVLPLLEISHSNFDSSSWSEEEHSGSAEETSTWRSFDSSLPPPLITPFDRGSWGRVLEQPSSREVGQWFYKSFDSLGSDRKAFIFGSVGLVFYCQGIYNSLIVSDLARIRESYHLPDDFSLEVPSRDAHRRQQGFVILYEDALITSLCLPLHPLVRDVLIYLGIAPS